MTAVYDIPEEILDRAQKIVEARFAHVRDYHPAMKLLQEQAIYFTAKRLHAGRGVQLPSAYGRSLALSIHEPPVKDPWKSIRQRIKLPSLPTVIIQLQECIEDPDSTVDDMARIIGYDPKLAAALLNLVNSAMFGMQRTVDSIKRAVTIAGSKHVSSLALCVVMTQMFQDTPQELLDMELFWKHSVVCGILAHAIAEEVNKFAPERFFAAGLLHDLGRAAIYSSEPELAKRSQELAIARQIPFEEAERQIFNFDHGMVGSALFQEWNLPEIFVSAASLHHHPKQSIGNEGAEIIHIANVAAIAFGFACNPEDLVPESPHAVWESAGATEERFLAITENLEERIDSVLNAMLPQSPS